MSPAQRVIASAAHTWPASPRSGPKPVHAWWGVRWQVRGGQSRRPRSGDRRIRGAWSGTGPRCCHRCGHRSCLKPSRDRAARWAILSCGPPRSPLGSVDRSGPPTAATPWAYGARGRACPRRGVACPLAPGTRAGQASPAHVHGLVRVWEAAAPDPGARLEGIRWCDANVDHVAPAQACALQYATRWLIEAYHNAITTGAWRGTTATGEG